MREVIMLLNKHEGAAAGPVTASLRAKCCTTGATPYLGRNERTLIGMMVCIMVSPASRTPYENAVGQAPCARTGVP